MPARAEALRGIALELERLANHTGDLGALAGDVGFLPTASYCGRIRGDFLNLTALLCGSRFGRGLVRPGGVGFDLDDGTGRSSACERLDAACRDVADAVEPAVGLAPRCRPASRTPARSPRKSAAALGLVGPAARACGVERDVRHDFPSGIFRFAQIPVSTWHDRRRLRPRLRALAGDPAVDGVHPRAAASAAGRADPARPWAARGPTIWSSSLVEGWRGEICHVALTDAQGRFARYKIVDPSFHNWFGLALALRDQQISDFPLCNKSFNLSYCGHDL